MLDRTLIAKIRSEESKEDQGRDEIKREYVSKDDEGLRKREEEAINRS